MGTRTGRRSLLASTVLVIAACGGGGDDSATGTATEPPATEPAVTDPPATEPPATDPPATDPPATEPPGTDATAGATDPPDLPDVATVARGAGLLTASDQFDATTGAAMNLIDGRSDRGWSANAPTGSFVIGVVHSPIEAIAIDTREAHEDQLPGVSAGRVTIERVLDVTTYPEVEWEPVGTFDLMPTTLNVIPTPGLEALALRFDVENGGHAEHLEVMEVLVYAEVTDANPSQVVLDSLGPVDATFGAETWTFGPTEAGIVACSDTGGEMTLEPVDGALHGTALGADGTEVPVHLSIVSATLSIILEPDGRAATAQSLIQPSDLTNCDPPGATGDDETVEASETTPEDQRVADPPLVVAAARSDLDETNALLAGGADPNIARDEDGWTPLVFAAQEGATDVAAALIDAGADLDRGTDDGWTALMIASQNGHEDTVALLLERGANPRVGRSNNWTALHSAALRNRVGVVDQLIGAGAPLNAAEDGFTPLTIAAQEGNDAVVTLLIDAGARLSGSPDAGPTPLYMTAQNDRVTTAELLLAAGADPDDGGTSDPPIVAAGSRSHAEIVGQLVAAGADIDRPRGDGLTALHWAAYNDDADLATLLLELGADPSVTEEDGLTPLALAEGRGSDAAAAVLSGAG